MSDVKYPITKTLKKAVPTVIVDTNIVKEWYVEVLYEFVGDEEAELPAWNIVYSNRKNVIDLNKSTNEYSRQELMDIIPEVYDDRIFHDHYESFIHNSTIKSEEISDFSIEQLS